MTSFQAFLLVLVAALCTLITRALPFVVFGGKKALPPVVEWLGRILPPAMMATLVIYCLKGVSITTGSHGIPELISLAVVTALHLWRRNTLLSIAAGTICYMLLVQHVF